LLNSKKGKKFLQKKLTAI